MPFAGMISPVDSCAGASLTSGGGEPGYAPRIADSQDRHDEAAVTHDGAAATHDKAVAFWMEWGDPERAELERRAAELERRAAVLERDMAALENDRLALKQLRQD